MSRPYTVQGVAAIALPAAAAALLVLVSPWWQSEAGPPGAAPWVVAALALVGAAAGAYVPFGAGTLGLGALAVAAVLPILTPVGVGLFAGLVFLLREGVRRVLLRGELPLVERTTLPRLLAAGGRLTLAGLVAAQAGKILRAAPGAWEYWLVTGLAFVAVLALSSIAAALWGPPPRRPLSPLASRLGLDLGGWAIGGAATGAMAVAGPWAALAPLAALAALALELARNTHRRRLAVARIRDLHEVSLAGLRIGDGTGDLAAVAGHVFAECRRVLPFTWYQFELFLADEERSWRARVDGGIEEGVPEPEPAPPALPGIHRRVSWRVLVRELTAEDQLVARLRFWCDPRRLEPTEVELLDALLPQIATSVHRALIEREARRDPLTSLPDRRVLEARLEDAYGGCRGDGSSMAVIMCDIDRFKRINDRWGHAAGDGALLKIAEVLERCRRETDLCARYGGEEFAVVLEHCDGQTALAVAERIRQAVGSTAYLHENQRIPLRISAGVASYPSLHVVSGRELLLLADEALYQAKRRGRDRCLLHLGRGRFQLPGGEVLGEETPPAEPRAPTLFA